MMARKLSALPKNQNRPTLAELADYPVMTSWFNPGLLLKLLGRVITTDLFGQYADRRLIEAALDTSEADVAGRDDISAHMAKHRDADGAVWLDFVADLGDGFDATYAIASLLARPRLELTYQGRTHTLPRAAALVMGGDEVYPTATRDEYSIKTRAPYQFAFPKRKPGAEQPRVMLIPGNHDWYDGLVNFLALFCRAKPTAIGNWRTCQRRSYFGFKLTEQAWVWGIDIALVADMDQPQADYFVAIAKAMPQNANVILCSAEPGWYGAEQETNSYRTLSYAAAIADNAGKSIKIPLVLSGDSHHYCRYESDLGTQYITSGGGGAFLHGTHHLPDQLHAAWLRHQPKPVLTLADSCYPDKVTSRRLLSGNFKFPLTNYGFSLLLGAIFTILGFAMSMLPRGDVGVISFLVLAAGFIGYSGYQEKKSLKKAVGLAVLHAGVQFIALLGLTRLFSAFDAATFGFRAQGPWWAWLIELGVPMVLLGGGLAGFIFGFNLMLTCRYADMNHNDAFSAMRLDAFRNFLRIRILGNQVTVYPIGLDRVPRRTEWKDNPASTGDPLAPYFIVDPDLAPRLLEAPIAVGGHEVEPTAMTVKQPGELPKE
jgi:hypothetical protein